MTNTQTDSGDKLPAEMLTELRKLSEKYFGNETYGKYLPFNHELQRILKVHFQAREREAELYGRANEHHIISGMLSNEELGKLDPSTIRRLKRRKEEITQQRYPNPPSG
jgi:hypothetical protein